MQYLKNLQDKEINELLDLGNDLKRQLKDLEQQGVITNVNFVEGIQAILQAHLHQTQLMLPIELRSRAATEFFDKLENLIKTYAIAEQAALVTIPMQTETILNETQTCEKLVDSLVETNALVIAKRKNIAVEVPEDLERGKSKYTLDQINEMLYQSDEYASLGSFINALEAIEQLEMMMADFDKYYILIIDRQTIQNNKAFALFRLNRLSEALACVESLLANHDEFALGYHTQAEILDGLERYQEALESMDRAIALENTPDKVAFREHILKKIG